MLNDTLRNTRPYQKILKEGLEKGREEGLEEGLEKARHEALQQERNALLNIIMQRFPALVLSVKKYVDAIDDSTILLNLIVRMSTVQTAEEAKQLLLATSGDNEQHT